MAERVTPVASHGLKEGKLLAVAEIKKGILAERGATHVFSKTDLFWCRFGRIHQNKTNVFKLFILLSCNYVVFVVKFARGSKIAQRA